MRNRKSMKQKSDSLKKINKIEKPARLTTIEKIQIINNRNDIGAILTDLVAMISLPR